MSPKNKTKLYCWYALGTCVVFFCHQFDIYGFNKIAILEKFSIVELYALIVFFIQIVRVIYIGLRTGDISQAMEPDMFGLLVVLLIQLFYMQCT
jgi:hypothetical protein